VTATPRQPSLARLVEFGITPDRELGQHFLIDSNVLDVVGRLLPLTGDEVVLEVGPGLGVLTAWLADRARLVHAIEIDRRLEPPLRATLAGRANVRLQFADAVSVDPGALDPPPDTMAANLPYHVATPIVVNALPHVERFCVMVQREIADRFFAAPGTKAYGAVSVLVQVACVRTGGRPVSRRVFAPEPNVDSALVAFRRRPSFAAGPEWDRLARVVHAAFGHRRKTLRNAFALAGLPLPPADVAALRAEALTPERYVRLAEELAA
jgi:16S rRNA (adenine1518-N6/adenine1519-N6)-dimethyltransferase